ncbi:twin-arginine translocase TatA/TatE family subunit [Shewanella sp. D64]|uniref:twin-arginine translocase TatA/TatE family subunit n=1 Tax=unclassified Shewanella TaxID=196818 RepID=UPI0022BA59FE|nr:MULTISPECIES: twin-arginine translocase TatA/TatE family subunit [unclassified Shewanella]MEC4726143.1 twin-arginine translocase TatA/TatE family subunit [Shewanella sp. D64]MEC4737941.1 twin-arginine translocase TatA/TatE family subunit [Shewanella sp. E94]WBJ96142.1 twin-arginine translocase TatA/TatE family subunit [Shewanella sp. MTB7]
MGNMGIWQLLIIAVIVILLFGTKKLRSLGGDLGGAVKGFKNAMSSEEEKKALEETTAEKTAPSVEKTAPNAEKKSESKDKEQV